MFGNNKINVAEGKTCNRIVSFSSSITEIIYALHAEDQLIGVTKYCNYPPEVKNKTKVGFHKSPDIEKVIFLNPDLVFVPNFSKPTANMNPDYIKAMQNANITVAIINTPYSTIKDIYDSIRTIAKYLGKEKEAENLIKDMEERLENVKKVKNKFVFSTPKIAHIFSYTSLGDPLWVSGRNNLANEVIEIAGGINVYSDVYRISTVDPETLFAKDPDIIIANYGNISDPDIIIANYGNISDIGMTYSNFVNDSRFKNLRAVKNNDVYKINQNIISRQTPRIIEAIESVIEMIISWQHKHTPKL